MSGAASERAKNFFGAVSRQESLKQIKQVIQNKETPDYVLQKCASALTSGFFVEGQKADSSKFNHNVIRIADVPKTVLGELLIDAGLTLDLVNDLSDSVCRDDMKSVFSVVFNWDLRKKVPSKHIASFKQTAMARFGKTQKHAAKADWWVWQNEVVGGRDRKYINWFECGPYKLYPANTEDKDTHQFTHIRHCNGEANLKLRETITHASWQVSDGESFEKCQYEYTGEDADLLGTVVIPWRLFNRSGAHAVYETVEEKDMSEETPQKRTRSCASSPADTPRSEEDEGGASAGSAGTPSGGLTRERVIQKIQKRTSGFRKST